MKAGGVIRDAELFKRLVYTKQAQCVNMKNAHMGTNGANIVNRFTILGN